MSEEKATIEKLQQMITRGPFNQWLNLTMLKSDDTGIEVRAGWREEWVVNPNRPRSVAGASTAG